MDMSTMTTAASTTSSMSMATSPASSDMTTMTFFTSTSTPLYSMSWMPASTGQYAGTCIFLIAFAAIFRAILAIRINFYEVLAIVKKRRGESLSYLDKVDDKFTTRPWRADEAVMLACTDVILAGMSYLLMIAVMTMNVGYFLSILAGVFLGSIVFGHLMAHSAAH
ncbi:hypothetical protein EG329_003145 [Mollisiaceae sp. DMI_Dod_QoI]|nr:hypothetical protein EG329_003145 [Helotiales sp. DMI_Dod_QoI]